MRMKCLFIAVLTVIFAVQGFAVDTDADGMTDTYETSQGYDPNTYTKIVYVDNARTDDTGDGLTLANAKKTISAAVNISKDANYENVILVAAGTYTGTNNRDIDFDGNDILLHSSVGAATTIIDLDDSGQFLDLTNGETLASQLIGFTIKNGLEYDGGAVFTDGASLTIKNCVFENNIGTSYAGAVSINDGQSNIENCSFKNNYSPESGAVSYYNNGSSTVSNCTFFANKTDDYGALTFNCWDSEVTINIIGCKFINNQASGDIAGILLKCDSVTANITNCLFFDNVAGWCPDIRTDSSSFTLNMKNVTVAKSKYTNRTLCYFNSGTTAIVENCILYGKYYASGSLSANNNCTQQDISSYGSGNITAIAELTGSGMLKSGSPLIDAGKSNGAPTVDINGTSRPVGSGVDIGCYEFSDSDSDGMDDTWEIINFGDLSKTATGDEDSDLLDNLAEYNYGTNPNSSDTDGDGAGDKTEIDTAYNPLLPLRTIYVDNARTDDNGDGLTLANAKKSISAAMELAQAEYDNEILVSAGTYTGSNNRGIYNGVFSMRLRSSAGAATTIVDLENSDYFLYLEASCIMDGFTVKNGSVSTDDGGAIYASGGEMIFKNCIFKDNTTNDWGWGGALFLDYCITTLENCVFDGNEASGGGGVLIYYGHRAVIKNCQFNNNESSGKGPGLRILVDKCDIEVSKCKFTNNQSSGDCGALYMMGGTSTLNVTNSLFMGNTDNGTKGDIYVDGDIAVIVTNVTIIKTALSTLACCFNGGTTAVLQNNIIHGWMDWWGSLTSNNNAYQSDLSSYGSGNIITSNPMLDTAGKLIENSPCIDVGLAADAPSDDLDGTSRPQGAGVDIGCYEYLNSITDTDNDGMDDAWENTHFGDLSQTATGDFDNDGVNNLDEYVGGTNPTVLADTDSDGMSDDWETVYMGDTSRDGSGDFDSDGVTDLQEYQQGRRPDKDAVNDSSNVLQLNLFTQLYQ